jgi:hypothetical protein
MLPRKSRLGLYHDRHYDRVRGFVVLAHAEIEFCIEKLAEGAVASAYAGYNVDGRLRSCLTSLVTNVPAKQKPPTWGKWAQARRIKWAVNYYGKQTLPNNHGASRRHILNVIGPLGISEASLDTTWLVAADTLFIRRGAMAHTGVAVQTDPNPDDERRAARSVAVGLARLDRLLTVCSS